jgi:potassium-transporting ATPase KdpC subunit
MSIMRNLTRAIRMTLVLWVLTAIIYPVGITAIGQLAFHERAMGSLVYNLKGNVVGSSLIGQRFISERYFHGRPSTVQYSQTKDAQPTGVSGASNLAPSNPELLKRIKAEITLLQDANIDPTADLLYTSGSGLDPHITLAAARSQLERVAVARGVPPNEIKKLIEKYTDGRFLGIFGEPGVNFLRLNNALAVDELNRQQNK